MSLEVKNAHRQAFKEIFSMKAVEGKLDKKGLADLFIMIDYKIPQEQFDEMVQRIFGKKEQIGFEEFLKIFNLKLTDYTFNDVRNAFKLLAKDDDRYIPLEKIKKVLLKNNVPAEEVEFLCHQLDPFTDTMKRVNYAEFLKSLSNV
ncbi:unnamed protein product (macronuclear) [Paramecium tetraurelia]|uniref:Chromosome undetermined scaffold_11, whole genome shotgun sequence n=4 Tax=Paramecium TaxID=5884 RepID=A0BIS5_PARTE|nr:uncharacterized protein GSPATT00004814001 [Paramecium tetraurelia]XP_001455565.1 uncharacterized protein GSPATT00003136001 [Paramecium tetraurelia]CAD8056578.1 unnamed protein product [Paramecium sonneborni]CAD8137275.1 unnamed protein product [Paramecium octaurelia]CAD8144506.1 unnamed protein product [Paramecium pentaurelia]CAD8059473.1 unnamed protein product [Paramecium sonneborni]CAK58442.1 unnamed protein product [Paramecium tetraurelia]|eukprot:XP_001425840.1 hypothetical protein (macronuclear) [Paramecium tetraurelia strain d4-2]